MKTLFSFLLMAFLSFSSFAAVNPVADSPQPFSIGSVQLKAGTYISLEITERLQSDKMTVGQLVRMQVRTNIVVNKRVVIRTGAVAMGRVKAIRKTTYNHAEEIHIIAVNVQTVDGQLIALEGNEQILKGEFRGQAAVVHPGTMTDARIMNNEWIDY